MRERPAFSIVTPCLNAARFIEDAILSVHAQGHDSVEHIVIDGSSTDGTVDILRKYSALRWVSEPDEGLTHALNKGLCAATGKIIGWLNSDDYYHPGVFRIIENAFDSHPDIDVFYGDMEFIDAGGAYQRRLFNTEFDPGILMFYRNYIPSNAAFWRRRILDDGHLPDASFKVIMDWDWWLHLAVSGYKFGFLPQVLASFRMRNDNVSTRLAHLIPGETARLQRKFEPHFCKKSLTTLERRRLLYTHKCRRGLLKLRRFVAEFAINKQGGSG